MWDWDCYWMGCCLLPRYVPGPLRRGIRCGYPVLSRHRGARFRAQMGRVRRHHKAWLWPLERVMRIWPRLAMPGAFFVVSGILPLLLGYHVDVLRVAQEHRVRWRVLLRGSPGWLQPSCW